MRRSSILAAAVRPTPNRMMCPLCGEGCTSDPRQEELLHGYCGCLAPRHLSCSVNDAAAAVLNPEFWVRCRTCGQDFTGELRLGMARAHYAQEVSRPDSSDDEPEKLAVANNLASALVEVIADYGSAQPLFEELLTLQRRSLGDDHQHTLRTMANLAGLLMHKGDNVAALPLCQAALAARRRTLGNEHAATLLSLAQLSSLYRQLGQLTEALPLCEEALAAQRRILGDEHVDTLRTLRCRR